MSKITNAEVDALNDHTEETALLLLLPEWEYWGNKFMNHRGSPARRRYETYSGRKFKKLCDNLQARGSVKINEIRFMFMPNAIECNFTY